MEERPESEMAPTAGDDGWLVSDAGGLVTSAGAMVANDFEVVTAGEVTVTKDVVLLVVSVTGWEVFPFNVDVDDVEFP